jgi:hypothetical protein
MAFFIYKVFLNNETDFNNSAFGRRPRGDS